MPLADLDCLAGHSVSLFGIDQHGFYPGSQFLWALQLLTRFFLQQEMHDIRKVTGVRSKTGSDSVRARLNHVLSPPVAKAAAHKADVRQSPPPSQLTDAIPEKNPPIGIGYYGVTCASPSPWQTTRFDRLCDFCESLDVSWYQNKFEVWKAMGKLQKGT